MNICFSLFFFCCHRIYLQLCSQYLLLYFLRDWEPTPQRSAYTPAQFENSLGKLHFSSVTAPRKIIDMDVVPNSDSQSTSQSQQKDTKKTRQLLLEIERVHYQLLLLHDH